MPDIEIIKIPAPIPYNEMLEIQYARRDAVERGDALEALFLLEHTPVITLGRNTNPAHLLLSRTQYAEHGIKVVEADRGGDVTYHGPGQLVAYPILNLQWRKPSVGWYLRTLEQCIIDTLASYGIHGERMEGHTGVWVNGAKIAAIGIGVRHWITFHGIALNVAPDMRHFSLIVPCGIADKPVTSMAHRLENPPTMEEIKNALVSAFISIYTRDI